MRRLVFFVAAGLATACQSGETPSAGAPAEAPTVQVAKVASGKVPNTFEFIGTVEAVQRVELRARVRGYVTEIGFEEGASVEENQVIYEVDTRPFRAEQRVAAASVQRSKARLDEARRQLVREEKLRAANVNAIQDLDTAQAEVDSLEAEIASQKAALAQAKLDVGYSKVRAPFAGRIGERLVDVGELVGESDSTLLAVVVQEDPMFVRFSPVERERRSLLELSPDIENPGGDGAPVTITLSDGSAYPQQGRLAFVDNVLDPSTRSLAYKAVVANPDRHLKPGESVGVQLELPSSDALLVPTLAVGSVQDVDYVYVVDAEDVAHYREVEVGRTFGEVRVVTSGLEADERVVVRGIQGVRDGKPVEVAGEAVVEEANFTVVDGDDQENLANRG